MHRPTKAGNRLIFQFHKTELKRLIEEAVEKIETEAYAYGYNDGMATPEEPDLDTPVIPKEPE